MKTIIDSHVHVIRDRLENPAFEPLRKLRESTRFFTKPLMRSFHLAQPMIRILPEPIRKKIDPFSPIAAGLGLLLESSPEDLTRLMDESGIQKAVVLAQPPISPNAYVMELCKNSDRLIPAVNIAWGTPRPGDALRKFHKSGARILKIHGAVDGEGVDSPRYRALLKVASDLDMTVILHTGCIHSSLLYRNPEMGRAQIFAPWFETYPKTQFVLAHMNYHDPAIALDLAESFENLWLETSWQPAEMVGEAVRRLGSDRILYGSDWPFLGDNFHVGIKRIQDAVQSSWITETDGDKILGLNAIRLFKLDETPKPNDSPKPSRT